MFNDVVEAIDLLYFFADKHQPKRRKRRTLNPTVEDLCEEVSVIVSRKLPSGGPRALLTFFCSSFDNSILSTRMGSVKTQMIRRKCSTSIASFSCRGC